MSNDNRMSKFEQVVSSQIEGFLNRVFRGKINYGMLTGRLEAEMEEHLENYSDRSYAPDTYVIYLHPDDYVLLSTSRLDLEHNLSEHISHGAENQGYLLWRRPKVLIKEAGGVPRLSLHVASRVSTPGADQDQQSNGFSRPRPPRGNLGVGQFDSTTPANLSAMKTEAVPGISGKSRDDANNELDPLDPPAVLWDSGNNPEGALASGLGRAGYTIKKRLLLIGRSLSNDIVVNDMRVTRAHARLEYRDGHYLLRDLGSYNGTTVNDEPIETVELRSGDVLSLGGVELLFTCEY